MIFWKEWRVLRGRFVMLAAFYGITLVMLPVESLFIDDMFDVIPLSLLIAGIALTFIPMILGMDAWVAERDEETEEFLLSKPISWQRLIIAKVGFRALLTLLLSSALLIIILVRIGNASGGLHLWTRPYVVWYVTLSILTAHTIIIVVTAAVSARAPYQSTSLIIGGLLGLVVCGLPLVISAWQLLHLQAPWTTFLLLITLLSLSMVLASIFFSRLEAERSVS